ncbi:MAG: restriction endonuclease subunit S [Chromatiales bacterium]
MTGEWRAMTLEKAPLEIIDGDRGTNYPNQAEFSATGHCLFLNAGNVTTNGFSFSDCAFITPAKDALLRKGKLVRHDVVLTTRGTVGNSAYFDASVPFDHIRINSGMVILRAKQPDLRSRYLYLFIRSALFLSQVAALRTGSAQPQLPIRDINRIEIPIPPPAEQRAIAHILGALDDKIELNRRMNQTLEAMARALFKSWFVDFDPVRAKQPKNVGWVSPAERNPPDKADGGLRGYAANPPYELLPHIADLFPARLVDSELGEIPEGWVVKRLGDLFSLDKGLSYKGQHLEGSGVSMVNLGCFLGQGRFESAALKGYSGEFQPRHTVREGDLVLANTDITQKRKVLGSPGIVPPTRDRGAILFTHHVFAARFHERLESWKSFAFHTLLRDEFRERATGFAIGTTVLALPRDAVLDFHFAAPPTAILDAFTKIAQPLLRRQWEAQTESRTLAALRDTLLPKLISGELRVKNAERKIAQAI